MATEEDLKKFNEQLGITVEEGGEAAEIIAEYYEIDEVIYETDKPSGIHRKPSDNSSLKDFLPDITFTPLKEGLYKAIEWFDNNYEVARR